MRTSNFHLMRILIMLMLIIKKMCVAETIYRPNEDHLITLESHGSVRNMTTSSGYPITVKETQTIGEGNPMFNNYFLESLTHLVMQTIPERVVHGKGTGAFGHFKVTHDISDICKAQLFSSVGKTTPLVARFSLTGASDTTRDFRGLAVKFYTEEGNFDFLGLNVEMFHTKDPIFFSAFTHAFGRDPRTLVFDENSRWDIRTLRPESLNLFMRVLGDRGIPDGYRHMPAFSVHTFELVNLSGNKTFVRFHLYPDLGIRNLTTIQAKKISNPEYATVDLYNAIAEGNFPTWTLSVQTIAEDKVSIAPFDIFDVTKYWPENLYPLRKIGILELNENPQNQFADIEQLAFNPGNLVPGIRGLDDVFAARVLTYRAAHIHRLRGNFNNIRVNCPFRTIVSTYNRDGSPPVKDNGGGLPLYYPNSFNGPMPYVDDGPPRTSVHVDPKANNFDQAAQIYIDMTEGERCRLIENIVQSLSSVKEFLQRRAVKYYFKIHKDLGKRIEDNLKRIDNESYENESCE